MGMTIDEVIQSLTAMKSVIGVNQLTINEVIEIMRKYQKIEQILKDIPYGGDVTVRRIQEVIEDGKID